MLLCINAVRHGLASGFLAVGMFALPGALAMYALAIGVSHLQTNLPPAVYALLSGFNAAAVGLIAFAAVKLAERAISDRISRLLVCFGGVMGGMGSALWYYPVLMASAGCATYIWDTSILQNLYVRTRARGHKWRQGRKIRNRRREYDVEALSNSRWSGESERTLLEKPLPEPPAVHEKDAGRCKEDVGMETTTDEKGQGGVVGGKLDAEKVRHEDVDDFDIPSLPWGIGVTILVGFVITFVLVIALRVVIPKSRIFDVFRSLYIAGTITFGGGPVLTPLLRDYIVSPGFVTPRNFLLGFSAFQALPGPGFNFAIYLGTLSIIHTAIPSFLGALITFVAIYTPGLCILVGFMSLWRIINGRKWFHSILRGVNAAAVGLVFAAVYKLWQIGYLTVSVQSGRPLGTDPWCVLVLAVVYTGSAWFGWNPPFSILFGGVAGVVKFAVVNA
ncbi:uncharacterized protein KY384_003948 [Bacidia gigantensis]|uniref:uncharacterized protein n=1 Tax=Bacidia gigantensis TaxID=2732470 RepID=UPI001D03E0F9|nr:uncharacterized protein KY384_003948 [Bacidia gigantensis]KAG8532307.1 hypothetical protein KY384_003948 [Bacidia gigantensis]